MFTREIEIQLAKSWREEAIHTSHGLNAVGIDVVGIEPPELAILAGKHLDVVNLPWIAVDQIAVDSNSRPVPGARAAGSGGPRAPSYSRTSSPTQE